VQIKAEPYINDLSATLSINNKGVFT